MANSSSRRINNRTATLMVIEALTTSVLLLAIITLVAGRFPHSLQKSPILTFDTSSVKTQLANQKGTFNQGNVPDWYELHYLSVCKGTWQSASASPTPTPTPGSSTQHIKNESSTICTTMSGGYTFSLPALLAADAGLPLPTPVLSSWTFAVFNTKMPFICLALAIAFAGVTTIAYFVTIVTTPRLTAQSSLLWPRVGYLASVGALNTLLLASAKVTATIHKTLKAQPVVDDGVAWATGGFYVLTWLPTALIIVVVGVSVALAFTLRESTSKPILAFDGRGPERGRVRASVGEDKGPLRFSNAVEIK